MRRKLRIMLLAILIFMGVEVAFGQGSSSSWEQHVDAGWKARIQRDDAEAERQFLAALEEAEKSGTENNLNMGLISLAQLYSGQHKYPEAELACQRALAVFEKALGPEHPYVADTLNRLAGLYRAQGKYSDAEPLYQRYVALLEKDSKRPPEFLPGVLQILADVYRAQGKYAQAEPLYQRAVAILEKDFGYVASNGGLVESLLSWARMYREQGRYAETAPLSQRAWTVYISDVDRMAESTAKMYRNQGKYADAERVERELEQHYATGGRQVYSSAVALQSQGKYAEAEQKYQQALVILERALGPESPELALCLENYTRLLHSMGRHEEAERIEARALAIRAGQDE